MLSYLCTLTTWHCPHSHAARRCCWRRQCSSQSISSACRAHNSNPPQCIQRSIDGTDGPTDGQTDGRAPYRHIDPAAHYADTVSNNLTIIMFIKTLELIQITLLPLNFSHTPLTCHLEQFALLITVSYIVGTACMRRRACVTVRCLSVRLSIPAWAHSSKPAAAGLLLWAHAGIEKQTGGQTPYRYTGPAPHAGSANNIRYRN